MAFLVALKAKNFSPFELLCVLYVDILKNTGHCIHIWGKQKACVLKSLTECLIVSEILVCFMLPHLVLLSIQFVQLFFKTLLNSSYTDI